MNRRCLGRCWQKDPFNFFPLFLIASICFSTAKTGREISGNNWLFRGCLGDITSRQFNNWSMCYFFSKRSRSILLHELWNVKSHRVKYSALKQDFTNFRWKKSKLQKSSHYFTIGFPFLAHAFIRINNPVMFVPDAAIKFTELRQSFVCISTKYSISLLLSTPWVK